jgi:hypothetical protein
MIPVFIKGLSLMEEATARGVHGLLKKPLVSELDEALFIIPQPSNHPP